jgi:hypothetical protein
MRLAAKAPRRRRPVSSTLGCAMDKTRDHSSSHSKQPSGASAMLGKSSMPPLLSLNRVFSKLQTAALRGILLPYCELTLGSHGRAARGRTGSLRPSRAGGAVGSYSGSSATVAVGRQRRSTPLRLNQQSTFTVTTAQPNWSFNRSANGRPPGPVRRYAVHCLRPGPGVQPLSPG